MRSLISLALLLVALLATSAFADEQTLYLLRHFEKRTEGNDPSLTSLGQKRAEQLAMQLADAGVEEIYSSDYHRTLETVRPLAQKLGLSIKLYDPTKLDELVTMLTRKQATIVVAGHSNTTPKLVRLLGGEAEEMDESRYGILFTLSKAGDRVETVLSNIALEEEKQ